jgi:hypothetical protein
MVAAKYERRNSPAHPASEFCGLKLFGNDGKEYYSKYYENLGTCRWVLAKPSDVEKFRKIKNKSRAIWDGLRWVKSPKKSSRKSVKRSSKKSMRRKPKKSTRKSSKKSVKRSPKKSVKRSPKKSMRRRPKKSSKKSSKRSPRKSVKKSTRRKYRKSIRR